LNRYNLPKEDYPITIRALRSSNREPVWTKVIDLPNEGPIPIVIPPLAKLAGERVIIQLVTAKGEVTET
jgi:hypothetical protein